MKNVKISKALEIELNKNSDWKLMLYLQNRGKISAYEIAKELEWTTGKVHAIIKKLSQANAIKTNLIIENGRTKKIVQLNNNP